MRSAIVLSAGMGTRLRPLTAWTAKPLVPVGDRPAIASILGRIRPRIARVVVNAHHHADRVAAWASEAGVLVVREDSLRGTAGGVAGARAQLGPGDVLVWNGDVLCDLDVGALSTSALATLAVVPLVAGAGNVGVDRSGSIVRLRSETVREGEVAGGDFAGIHRIGEEIRAMLPDRGCLVGDVYLPLLRRGAELRARMIDVPYVDIGSMAGYVAANRAWLGDRAAWSASSARVNAPIDGSIIGSDAIVDAPALRSIVWPGAHVERPVEDAVVTPFGVVYGQDASLTVQPPATEDTHVAPEQQ